MAGVDPRGWLTTAGQGTRASRLLIILLLLAWPVRGQGPCGIDFPLDANPTPINEDDICNFHQVDPEVYRGGRPRPSAFPKLVNLGIRTILDLEGTGHAERERAAIEELNSELPPEQRIAFISFPIHQDEIEVRGISHARLQSLFRHFQEARKPIFLQCYLGRDRTGLVVAVYRLLRQQKSYHEAYAEAVHYHFYPGDSGLKRTLDRYKSTKKLKSLLQP